VIGLCEFLVAFPTESRSPDVHMYGAYGRNVTPHITEIELGMSCLNLVSAGFIALGCRYPYGFGPDSVRKSGQVVPHY
jgi:hypothetical protein